MEFEKLESEIILCQSAQAMRPKCYTYTLSSNQWDDGYWD